MSNDIPSPAPPPGEPTPPPPPYTPPPGWSDPTLAPPPGAAPPPGGPQADWQQAGWQQGAGGWQPGMPPDASKKVAAGVCGILLGALGIHKFILGYKNEGLIMLLTTIFTCGIAGAVWGVIGIVEGIIYLTKSDEEFHRTYVLGHKGWF